MADEQGQDKVQKKSGMKLFLIIGVAVAVAVSATVGAMTFMNGSKDGHKTEKAEKSPPEATVTYPLDPFIVNIYDGQELRYLKIKVEMELSDPEAKNEVTARQPQIRDGILVILTTKTWQDLQYQQGKNQLKQEIMAAVTRMVTPGKVKQIYFTDFVVQ